MERTIIVVGAGIAGLAAGCYAQMNGYRTRIFEMHSLPGGVCTGWRRNGYTIDGCIHWLTGSGPASNFHSLWKEVGVIQDLKFVDHDVYAQIEGRNGRTLVVYSDVERLRAHLLDLAPEDADLIAELADGVRVCADIPMPVEKPRELFTPFDRLHVASQFLPFLRFWQKWRRVTISEFAQRFKNPLLRSLFPHAVNLQHPPDFPMLAFLTTLAWMNQKTAGYPIGGSLALSRAMEKRYLVLGGKIHYNSRVVKILVEDDNAVGVQTADGSEHRSDVVISAADGHYTIFEMLEGNYASKTVRSYYDTLPVYDPLVYIGLGVSRSFAGITPSVTGFDVSLDNPIIIAGRKRTRLSFQIYNFDPSLSSAGKTVLRVWFSSDYDYWKDLASDRDRYKEEKLSIANNVISALGARYPGLAGDIEMIDVATPMTFERYTGNWRGSFEGWLISNKTLVMRMKKTLPRLRSFYMAGQWVEPGGSVPTSLMSGRNAVQLICARDNQIFRTSNPDVR